MAISLGNSGMYQEMERQRVEYERYMREQQMRAVGAYADPLLMGAQAIAQQPQQPKTNRKLLLLED